MRERVQQAVRDSGLPRWWNGSRHTRDRTRGRLRGLLRAPVATSTGWGFRIGRQVFLGVAPDADLFIGNQVTLYDQVRLNVEAPGARLVLEDRVYLNTGTQVFCRSSVQIGAGSAIGFGCVIMDTNFHALDGHRAPKPVTIGSRVWLGAGVTVLPGVTIGDGAVVAAGAVVSADLPAGQLAVGAPARPVRAVTWEP